MFGEWSLAARLAEDREGIRWRLRNRHCTPDTTEGKPRRQREVFGEVDVRRHAEEQQRHAPCDDHGVRRRGDNKTLEPALEHRKGEFGSCLECDEGEGKFVDEFERAHFVPGEDAKTRWAGEHADGQVPGQPGHSDEAHDAATDDATDEQKPKREDRAHGFAAPAQLADCNQNAGDQSDRENAAGGGREFVGGGDRCGSVTHRDSPFSEGPPSAGVTSATRTFACGVA